MKASLCGFIVLFLIPFCSVSGQESVSQIPDTIIVQQIFDQAWKMQKGAKYDSAITLFTMAESMFVRMNKTGAQVRCRNGIATCLRLKGNYDKALEALFINSKIEEVILKEEPATAAQRMVALGSIYRQQGKYDSALTAAQRALIVQNNYAEHDTILLWDTYSLLAGIYLGLGDHDSALAYNHGAIRLFPNPNSEQQSKISSSNNAIAIMYESRGDYRQAAEYFKRALEIHPAAPEGKHPDVARLYGNVAVSYFRLGDYDQALEYHFKSLAILNATLESDHPSFGLGYNNIAMVYRSKGEFGKALEYGEKSKDIFVKKLGAAHVNVAGVVNNIGRTYADMGKYDSALQYYQNALVVWEEKLGQKHPNVLQSYFNIGEAYGNLKQFEEAKRWLIRSLLGRRETLGDKNVKTAQSYNALGTLYGERGQYDTALVNFQSAIVALLDDFNDSTIAANPVNLKSPSDLDLLASISGKAKSLFLQGSKRKNRTDIRTSLDTYEHAIQLVENIRRGFGSEGSKLQLSRMSFDVYERAIESAVKLFEMTKDVTYLSTAFSFAERSKAGILQDALSALNATQFAGIPDTLLERESALRISLTYNETQLQKEKEKRAKANKKKIEHWENTIFDLKRQYENLIKDFEKEYPHYYSLKHQSETIALADIQKRLPDNKTALVEYVVGDSSTTIFLVTKKRCVIKSQRVTGLSSLVNQFRRSIQNIESENYVKLAGNLYQHLIAPVQSGLKGIQKLYIVPDGILNHLPFEALITKRQNKATVNDFSMLPYLIKQYDISYQISARFLEKEEEQTNRNSKYSFMGLAPVFADKPSHSKAIYIASAERVTRSRTINGEGFVELKESETEVKDIFNLFELHHKPAKLYLHSEADESKLTSADAGKYTFIHIATHGLINEEKPELSGIIFAAPEKNTNDDGILYSGEIYNLKLNADLVVLSACETGLGTIVKGEGMLGLTRGFMYAGAKNILVSLWQVADKSTAELMVEFYRNVLNNQSYSTALRNAKLAMIKKGKYAHPIEWSPFVLTGK